MNMIKAALPEKKMIALVAHDNKKQQLKEWCASHHEILSKHELCGTGTTGAMLEEALRLPVKKYISGPLGGDQQIGGEIAAGNIHCLIFFWDPFQPMPHDPDVKALLRLATAWNIPVACNTATADCMLESNLFDRPLDREVPDCVNYQTDRKLF